MIRVNENICAVCGTCVGACPADAIVIETDVIRIAEDRCVSCGSCVDVCPVGALKEE